MRSVPLRLPWRIRRLPGWVRGFPVLVLSASVVLRILKPNYLCGPDPWEAANAAMTFAEIGIVGCLVARAKTPVGAVAAARRRRLAALLGTLLMIAAMALLTFLHFLGPRWNLKAADVSECGYFGPIPLPYGVHMALCAALVASLGVIFLHEETVLVGPCGECPAAASRP